MRNTGEKHVKHDLVFDAGILGLFFQKDPRIRELLRLIGSDESHKFIAGVNLAEFYYKTCRTLGRQTADARFNLIIDSGFIVDSGAELDRLAGLERCRGELDLSLADCYALALSKRVRGVLLTTDSELGRNREVETRHFPIE